MAEATTTLVSEEQKSGSSQRGPWTVYKFTDAAGQKFSTFDDRLATKAREALNHAVVIEYEHNGKGNNLTAVLPASNGQSPANGSEAVRTALTSSGGAPVAPQGDAVGKTKAIIAAQIAPALFESLPADEQTFENAVQIMDRLVQYAFANTIPY
jgi:hypothetical protein